MTHKNTTLPLITVVIRKIANPSWVGVYENGQAINMDSYYLNNITMVVEVLTLHIEKCTMRVRLPDGCGTKTIDMDATPFFQQMKIIKI